MLDRNPGAGAALTFFLSATYVVIAVALVQGTVHLLPAFNAPLFASVVTDILLVGGLLAIASLRVPQLRPLSAVGMVRRPSVRQESALGGALGWGIGVALVLPGVLAGQMQSALRLDGFHLGATAGSTLLLFLFVLGRQLVLCGLPFQSLSRATSPLFASVAFAGVAALLTATSDHGDVGQVVTAATAQLLLCMAAARTRAIWLGGALQFLWGWSLTVLFGLRSFLWPDSVSAVQSSLGGPRWATGAYLGPETALWGGVVLVLALIVVWRVTKDYAWHYTFDPIVGAGYAMDVPPPAEHTRMEQQAAVAAPLVQIDGVSQQSAAPADTPRALDEPARS